MTSSTRKTLALRVQLFEGRYHGQPISEWPPSPARLFQALLAAAGTSQEWEGALTWLEGLPPPSIAAPRARRGQSVKFWVPNNDLDAVGGDPDRIAELRTAKIVSPRLFDNRVPLVYLWSFDGSRDEEGARAAKLCELALGLYQLGRGCDPAFARAEIIDEEQRQQLLEAHPGQLFQPTPGARGSSSNLPSPEPGSLASLRRRYAAFLARFSTVIRGKKRLQLFAQPPKPRFAQVPYESPPLRMLFEIKNAEDANCYATTPLCKALVLTEALRDAAAERLRAALPECSGEIDQALIGRRVEGRPRLPAEQRARLIVLPSIGHRHVDRGIRRLLVEIPRAAPIPAEDLLWAFSGLRLVGPAGTKILVLRSDEQSMLRHYGLNSDESYRTWRSVTPLALVAAGRGRKAKKEAGAKGLLTQAQAERAIRAALRHAGVQGRISSLRLQREPFEGKGARAESFAPGARFPARSLWHTELVFAEGLPGPLVLGDGRFLGLGLLAPVSQPALALVFKILSGQKRRAPHELARALRRAVMARYQMHIGARKKLPAMVSGHEEDGRPTTQPHLTFLYDRGGERLLVIPPFRRDHRQPDGPERRCWSTVQAALADFSDLRAGSCGRLTLARQELEAEDHLLRASQDWSSATDYLVNRHQKGVGAEEAVTRDVQATCRALGLPQPEVKVLRCVGLSGLGLSAQLSLHFKRAIPGPLVLGRSRHEGGGLFRAEPGA